MNWVMVAMGGALGSMARYGVSSGTSRWVGTPIPWATAAVNLAGCAIAGVLLGSIEAGRLTLTADQRALVFSGVLGGLTTFSGFGMDTLALLQDGKAGTAVLNIAIQLVAGLGLVLLGYTLTRR